MTTNGSVKLQQNWANYESHIIFTFFGKFDAISKQIAL